MPYKNYKKIILIPVLLSLFLMACNNSDDKIVINKNTILFSEFPKEENTVFENLCEYKYGEPKSIYILDSSLLLFNFRKSSNYFIYNYSLKNKLYSKGYISKGRGPGEALGASCMGVYANTLWVYDVTLKKILTINKAEVFKNSNSLIYNEYSVKNYYYEIYFIDSLNYLGVVNLETDSKISKVDLLADEEIFEYGEFKSIPDDVPLRAFKDAYTAYIYAKPSGDKVVLPYRYTDVIEIFDIDKNTSKAIHGPEGFEVIWKAEDYGSGSVMSKTEDTRKAFVQATITDNYIYALYSGHFDNDDNWSYGKTIYVYDWDGNPIKKIILDRYIYSLAVSKNDKTLYSFDRETGYIIKADIN